MNLTLKPIKQQDLVAADIAQAAKDAGERINQGLAADGLGGVALSDWACLHWRGSGVIGAEEIESSTAAVLSEAGAGIHAAMHVATGS